MLSRIFESRLVQILEKIIDIICLGFLWLAFSLPIITIGTATTSFYYTLHKVVYQGRGYLFKEFLNSFIANFKQTMLSWLIFLGLGAVFGYDLYIVLQFRDMGDVWGSMWVIFALLICFLIIYALYVFFYIARFENTFKNTFKVAGAMAIKYFYFSILIFAVFVLFAVFAYAWTGAIMIAPTLFGVVTHPLWELIFRKHMSNADRIEEDERNNDYTKKDHE